MKPEWRPMHTAPKDGTRILAYYLDHRGVPRVEIYEWDADKYATKPRPYWKYEWIRVGSQRTNPPVGWMPLPGVALLAGQGVEK